MDNGLGNLILNWNRKKEAEVVCVLRISLKSHIHLGLWFSEVVVFPVDVLQE